jgi:D-alanyl-D-alanine carboxypeptidase (penicillin-binding protein 5/6)
MDDANTATLRRDGMLGAVRATWPALVAIVLAGVAYVILMPPGLPYDEPAHWLNVQWWLDHWTMPVIGEPGTSYEAQMGPVAYAVYAIVAWPFQALWGDEAAFYAARAVGIVQLVALALTLATVARRALKPHRAVLMLVVLVVGLNPMLLAVSTSIQNDTLSLLLGAAALLVAISPSPPQRRSALLAGVLLGLAILTKVTVWPIAVGVALALVVRRRYLSLAIVALTSAVVAGWWFVRNIVLYGDLTGRAGVEAAGYDFPPVDAGPVGLVKQAMTYLWLPTEYVRNVVVSPVLIDGLVLLLTVFGAVGLVMLALRRDRGSAMVLAITATAVVAVVSWVILVESTQSISFRTAYPALLAFYAGVGALTFLGSTRARIAMLAPLAIINVWFLMSLATLTGVGPLVTF